MWVRVDGAADSAHPSIQHTRSRCSCTGYGNSRGATLETVDTSSILFDPDASRRVFRENAVPQKLRVMISYADVQGHLNYTNPQSKSEWLSAAPNTSRLMIRGNHSMRPHHGWFEICCASWEDVQRATLAQLNGSSHVTGYVCIASCDGSRAADHLATPRRPMPSIGRTSPLVRRFRFMVTGHAVKTRSGSLDGRRCGWTFWACGRLHSLAHASIKASPRHADLFRPKSSCT